MSANLFLLPCASIKFAWQESNLSGIVIVVILFIGSILAWTVMVSKYIEMRHARRNAERFLQLYRKESHPVSLYLRQQGPGVSPLYEVYEKTCRALGVTLEQGVADPEDLFMGGVGNTHPRLSELHVSAVRNVAERTMADQALLLETHMGFLATATTTAPFLGLLGTVWGVMSAFSGMAVTGSAMLSAVAPGISGALLTTVVGLLVALPSAIGYNVLSDQIRRMTVMMDNFSQELMSDVDRYYRWHEQG